MAYRFPFYPIYNDLFPFLSSVIERALGISQLNKIKKELENQHFNNPSELAIWILNRLNIKYQELPPKVVQDLQNIKGPLILVANHPLGGIEVLMLIILLHQIRGTDFQILSNSFVGKLKELDNIVIGNEEEETDNPYNVRKAREIIQYLTKGGAVGLFPNANDREITLRGENKMNQQWDDRAAKIIMLSRATVVPVYFHGKNGYFYQVLGHIFPRMQKMMETRNFLGAATSEINYRVGKKISFDRLEEYKGDPHKINDYIRSKLFLLSLLFSKNSPNFGNFMAISQFISPILMGNDDERIEPIIPPVPTSALDAAFQSLPPTSLLVDAAPFKVYAILKSDAPIILQEIGRLREITFRDVGEGSGKEIDIDNFDEYYYQLILWDADKKQIAGGYRIGKLDEIIDKYDIEGIYIASIFNIQAQLLHQANPALELGRSFVTKEYQKSYQPLLLLWTGIAHFVFLPHNRKYKNLIGPVSISAEMNSTSKTLIVNFMEQNNIRQELSDYVSPKHRFNKTHKAVLYYKSFGMKDLKDVQDAVSELEEGHGGIPILFKHYLKMGAKMLAFNVDPDFSDVLDCLMMTDLTQTDRHLLGKYMGKENLTIYLQSHNIKV